MDQTELIILFSGTPLHGGVTPGIGGPTSYLDALRMRRHGMFAYWRTEDQTLANQQNACHTGRRKCQTPTSLGREFTLRSFLIIRTNLHDGVNTCFSTLLQSCTLLTSVSRFSSRLSSTISEKFASFLLWNSTVSTHRCFPLLQSSDAWLFQVVTDIRGNLSWLQLLLQVAVNSTGKKH